MTYVVGGCDLRMQRKMYKEVFEEAGCDFEKQVIPLDLRNMSTEDTLKKVRETIESIMTGKEIK